MQVKCSRHDDHGAAAREAVLRRFQWVEGDASFTPLFLDPDALTTLGPGLVEPFTDARVTAVVAPEAHGFIIGSPAAVALGVGFVAARKPGNHVRAIGCTWSPSPTGVAGA